MTQMLLVLLVIVGVAAVTMFLHRSGDAREETPEQVRAWEQAILAEQSQVGRILLNVARPLARAPSIYEQATSPQYRFIQSKLLAAGGAFGGDVEVFLAVQVLTLLVGGGLCAVLFVSGVSGIIMITGAVIGVGLASWPWSRLSSAAKKRADAVADGLPEFAELLQMPLSSGMGILPALGFTAERLSGPVADEVENLRTVIRYNPEREAEAFMLAGERLGTPEAKAFFAALMQAHLEGAKVIKNLAAQAEALREAAHQRARARAKQIPLKMVFIMAAFLVPVLFILALIPTIYSFGQL